MRASNDLSSFRSTVVDTFGWAVSVALNISDRSCWGDSTDEQTMDVIRGMQPVEFTGVGGDVLFWCAF